MNEYIEKILATAPPLTDERREKLAQIFGAVNAKTTNS